MGEDCMTARLRAFVSSTMTDLANERQEVVRRLQEFNIEPVNAEGLLPNGATSWDLLSDEIKTCHLVILILGERYGWIPTSGAGAGQDKSVTHMEFDAAKQAGLIILPFLKQLSYDAPRNTDDAERRDKFRGEVADWDKGYFKTEFRLAHDLGILVKNALADLFAAAFPHFKERVRVRAQLLAARSVNTGAVETSIALETSLRREISDGGCVLIAGAGMSINAGYPSADALSDVLLHRMGWQGDRDKALARYRFPEIAAAFEANMSRGELLRTVAEVLDTPQAVTPTLAHRVCVKTFPVIVTTNYDSLFEQACREEGLSYQLMTSSGVMVPGASQGPMIFKIDGSVSDPQSLVLTDADGERVRSNGTFWKGLESQLKDRPVVVIGHSIRDGNTRRLLEARNRSKLGLYVSPAQGVFDKITLDRFGFRSVVASSDSFMSSLHLD
jgi:hypothetical protein